MGELLLIVRLAGRSVAIPASEVEAVVELDGITAVPGAPPYVAGLSALRSRVLTVIDSGASLGLPPRETSGSAEAIVVPSGGHTYALLVDQVEDVVETAAAPGRIKASPGLGWGRVARAMVEAGGDLLLLVDPHAIVAGPPALEAA